MAQKGLDWDTVLPPSKRLSLENATVQICFLAKRNGSPTCLVQSFGRAGTYLERDPEPELPPPRGWKWYPHPAPPRGWKRYPHPEPQPPSTKRPSWGYSDLILGAVTAFLSSFDGNCPRFLKNLSKLTFEKPHEGRCVVPPPVAIPGACVSASLILCATTMAVVR